MKWTWGDCTPQVVLGGMPAEGDSAQLTCSGCQRDLSYAAKSGEWTQYVLHVISSVAVAGA